MTRQKLEIKCEDHGTPVCVYKLTGDLMGTSESYALQDLVREKVANGTTNVILDLGGIHRIDSSGIGILVAVMYSTHRAGGRMVLASLSPQVKKVLEIVFLLDSMEHAESVEDARKRIEQA